MRNAAIFMLIAIGTAGAAVGIARTDPSAEGWVHTFQIDVPLTAASLAVLSAGIAVKIVTARTARRAVVEHGGSFRALLEAARAIEDSLASLEQEANLPALHRRVEELLSGPVADFAENRTALVDAFGVGCYARVMDGFATGERYLNRAWSAATDGYADEAAAYARRAARPLRDACAQVRALREG